MLSFPFLSHIEFKCDATDIYVMFRNLCLCEGSNGFIVIYYPVWHGCTYVLRDHRPR